MKRIILLALLVVAGTMIIWSQVPQAMNYKAIAQNNFGLVLTNRTVTLRFSIMQGGETGSIVYQETHRTTTNKFGLMNVEIGKGTPVISSFDQIDWSAGVYYIKIEMDPNGGTNFRVEDPAHQLLSVPYAFYAGNADGVGTELDPVFTSSSAATILSGDIANWNTAYSWSNHADAGYLKTEVDGSITNEIQSLSQVLNTGNDAGAKNVINLADPVNEQDAATKIYVDNKIAELQAIITLFMSQFTFCGGVIVDLQTDESNCGSCGNVCRIGFICNNGQCECPAGQMNCGGYCKDIMTDTTNCGSCGNVCRKGLICNNGQCECPAGQMNCGGVCKDIMTDRNNCGSCGNVCRIGFICNNGQCECPAGQMNCGGSCKDIMTDTTNCGSCGNICPYGYTCINGQCTKL